jgi:teneurin
LHHFDLRRESPVGKFVVVGRTDGDRASVRSVSAGHANEVNRAIFSKVLDGASIVDYTAVSHGGVDAYFFTKENVWESSEDIKALYRLGPLVNLTTHDTQTDAGMTMDVKVHLDGAVVNIRYGTVADGEKGRILRHAYKTLARRAWAREKEGTVGSRNWDSNQRQQLGHKGSVDGYEVVYKRDPFLFPELANDLENVQVSML